jgi:hypothetical protein
MATQPQYAATPEITITQISTANTNRDGSGTITEVCAGPSSARGTGVGRRITRVTISATASTTAGAVRFFISTNSGTNDFMIVERSVPAITVATGTTPPFRTEVAELVGLVLQGTVSTATTNLYASTNNAETFNILVESASL